MLLRQGKAAIFRRYPFTIILKERAEGETQPLELKVDPGSKSSGIVLTASFQRGNTLVWAAELEHRSSTIKDALTDRRAVRRSRRNRQTRYRQPRFDNRTRPKGWLPPSLMSRVHNIETWAKRLRQFAPISSIAVETARFDTQALQNPEISGVEYQQGTLYGCEVRQYLLTKWDHKCAYCGAKGENVPLNIDHIQPKSRGGSDRVSNLLLACVRCNQKKGNRDISEFLARRPQRLAEIEAQRKASLKDAAAINATRYAIGDTLKRHNLPTSFWSGGRTKYNRSRQGYPKAHWIDAACVGESGEQIRLDPALKPLSIKAMGHGNRRVCNLDKYGFPDRHRTRQAVHFGFKTGDMVRAVVTSGKKAGSYTGRVTVRDSGYFKLRTAAGVVDGLHHRFMSLIHRKDGYGYY
jgi:5-methylcytosine-specific restriction endonuclease McrA